MFGTREIEISPTAPVALIALADLKTALGIAGSGQDTELTALIAEASASVEGYCGTVLGVRTVTERHFLEEGGSAILLNYSPAVTFTSLAINDAVQTPGDYRLNGMYSSLRKVDRTEFGVGEHKIVYDAGFTVIPPAIARAALELAKYLYNSKGVSDDVRSENVEDVGETEYRDLKERTMSANGIDLPSRVALMLAPYKRLYAL